VPAVTFAASAPSLQAPQLVFVCEMLAESGAELPIENTLLLTHP
jgi:hypothetical protein